MLFCDKDRKTMQFKLENKKILLGITGSIAAYKAPLLVRELITHGAKVQVIMTPSAAEFVTPMTFITPLDRFQVRKKVLKISIFI